MGYSVLYIAFGIVAVWLLGEVLLQYKARLRWRLLAFAGFLGVAGGVALREVVLILLGAAAFGTGQTFVTLSYKRGFSAGWALRNRPVLSRRTLGAGEPTLAVTPVEESYEGAVGGAAVVEGQDVLAERDETGGTGDTGEVYRPVPMHEDSGEYPVFDGRSSYTPDPYTSGGYEGYGAQGYAGWGADPQPAQAASYDAYDPGYGQGGWGGQYDQYDQSGRPDHSGQAYGYEQAGYQEQPATAGYGADVPGAEVPGGQGDFGGYGTGGYGYEGYDAYGTGGWPVQPQQEPYPGPQGGGAAYDPQAQPYIPQQQHQSPYEQAGAQEQPVQPQYTGEYDPYDPYRY